MPIVTSVGELGSGYRSDERFYTNEPHAINQGNLADFTASLPHKLDVTRHTAAEHPVTRSVVRAVMSRAAFIGLERDQLLQIEAAAPINGSDEQLVYFAANAAERTPSAEQAVNIAAEMNETRMRSPHPDRKQLYNGFYPAAGTPNPEQLHKLWGSTFGWTIEGCETFTERLRGQAERHPSERDLWFEGVTRDGKLVAASMGERLTMPSTNALGHVALVELTEWAVQKDLRHRRLGPAMVNSLMKNVSTDLQGVPHLSFAECSVHSGAHRAAVDAGLVIPDVHHPLVGEIRQVLVNNVRVDDNLPPANAYRSFALVTDNERISS